MTSPLAHLRRSPLYRTLEAEGATWSHVAGAAIAETAGAAGVAALAIVDLSPLPRIGFKGRETIAAMKKRGIAVEATPNRAYRQTDGGLCLVLAPGEILLLSDLAGESGTAAALLSSWRLEDGERTYPMPRQDSHAWLAVTGAKTPELFAKICAVDLRPKQFGDLAIAQTSIAKMSAIVVRADHGARPLYHVLADSAAAGYFLNAILDAAAEFGGRLAGRDIFGDRDTS